MLPELWLLPKSAPMHPSRLWCHCRQVYLPMAWLYGVRARGPVDGFVTALRDELYGPGRYEGIEWAKQRDVVSLASLEFDVAPMILALVLGPLLDQAPVDEQARIRSVKGDGEPFVHQLLARASVGRPLVQPTHLVLGSGVQRLQADVQHAAALTGAGAADKLVDLLERERCACFVFLAQQIIIGLGEFAELEIKIQIADSIIRGIALGNQAVQRVRRGCRLLVRHGEQRIGNETNHQDDDNCNNNKFQKNP